MIYARIGAAKAEEEGRTVRALFRQFAIEVAILHVGAVQAAT
jgi:hypothetical protein